MPREEIRAAKVEGLIPSSCAAPLGPETFPLVCFRAFIMASRSSRFSSSRVMSLAFAAAFLGGTMSGCTGEAGKSR